MPTTFHDREQAFEAKFAHDEAFRFRAIARRDKLLAHWAATKLRLSDEATAALVKDVLAIRDVRGHDQELLRFIADFLSAHDAHASTTEVAAALDGCMQQALHDLIEGGPDHSELN